jgi:biopolymer transport protein ExbD
MNLKRRKRANAEVHTAAMNDIMFFLMLFFLIASTVTNPNIVKLMLPRSDSGQSLSKKTINVVITKDLEYYIERQPIALDQLQAGIQNYQKQTQELTIVLHTEPTVSIQDVVNVMDIANRLKVKMVLATKPK